MVWRTNVLLVDKQYAQNLDKGVDVCDSINKIKLDLTMSLIF